MAETLGDDPVSVAEARRRIAAEVSAFSAVVDSLAPGQLLAPLGNWSPRDIVAHLIGWNRHVVRGSRQLQLGELPFYDEDPGEDFSNVNAELIREYRSTDPNELLTELRASADELSEFLARLDEADWARDFGVRHGGEALTISGTVGELIRDYPHHKEQIQRWRDSSSQ